MRILTVVYLMIAMVLPGRAAMLEPAQRFDSADFGSPGFVLARTAQSIELVRATRDIAVDGWPGEKVASDLRVSLIVMDTGPSTDVSPLLELHLAMLNTITEYGTAWAIEPVAAVYRFDGVTRTAPGIYEVRAVVLNGQEGQTNLDCYFQEAVITVDARALSVAVRQAKGLPEFDAQRYTAPMPLSIQAQGCAASPY
ncbi:MAG: hypothetical protein AAGK00_11985 [Pseudomonadota bacterium]